MSLFSIKTTTRIEMIDITARVAKEIGESGIQQGFCHVFVPHTTAALTINENSDPDVPRDILAALDRMVPLSAGYRHGEGNSAAHVKASLMGSSQMLLIQNGRLILGTWQALFFCEFDGPRTRNVWCRLTAF